MKTLFISNDPSMFDATSAVRNRMRAYAAAIGELHILSVAPRGAHEEQEGNLFLHPVHTLKLFRIRTLTARARTLIQKYDIEVVSAQDPFEQGLAALRAVRGTKAKLHVQVHTDFLSPWFVQGNTRMSLLNRYRRRIADRVVPMASGIRVVSNRVKASLTARYGTHIPEPSVIPITVDATVPAPAALPAHQFKFVLIAVGRLEPEKHVGDILTALSLIKKQYSMIGLFIVGEGRERARLERMAHTLDIEKQVVFLGERTDARALMKSAQAFVQASAYEGYGRTFIEAALAQVPIITTDVGIIGDVFKDGKEVLAVPVAKPVMLSHAIAELVENNTLREELLIQAEAAARTHLASAGDLPSRIAEDLAQTLQRS